MAEFLSIGKVDVNTAMWLREMALDGSLPSDIRMVDGFMSYRMGQSYWQFISERYGRDKVGEIFRRAAGTESGLGSKLRQRAGVPVDLDTAFQQSIGKNLHQLSLEWRTAIMRIELPKIAEHAYAREFSTEIVGPDHDGSINFSPIVSPDGKYVVFMSGGRDMTLGVYAGNVDHLSDEAHWPFVINKPVRLVEGERSDKFDSFRVLSAAGSFSPDGKTVAFATMSKNRPTLTLVTVEEKAAQSQAPIAFDEGRASTTARRPRRPRRPASRPRLRRPWRSFLRSSTRSRSSSSRSTSTTSTAPPGRRTARSSCSPA